MFDTRFRLNSCEHKSGHSFEPRYDHAANTHEKTYIKDICIHCGTTVERKPEGQTQ